MGRVFVGAETTGMEALPNEDKHSEANECHASAGAVLDLTAFSSAWEGAVDGSGLALGASRLDLTPEALVFLADQCAVRMLDGGDPSLLDLQVASAAFICGLLLALELCAPDREDVSLLDAVRAVLDGGPTRVLAAHCDAVTAVAVKREAVHLIEATLYGREVPIGRFALEVRLLFDLALAIGLAMRRRSLS